MSNPISILSTKILSDNYRQAFIDAKIDLLEDDFIAITNIDFDLSNVHQNLIFSSQNAILSLMEQPDWEKLQSKTVFCVGLKSKEGWTAIGLSSDGEPLIFRVPVSGFQKRFSIRIGLALEFAPFHLHAAA